MIASRQHLEIDLLTFTKSQIAKITQNYTTEVGKGGFGTVYVGSLPGMKVAVKVLNKVNVHFKI